MIKKMEVASVPMQFDGRDSFVMWEKIQELVTEVNELNGWLQLAIQHIKILETGNTNGEDVLYCML